MILHQMVWIVLCEGYLGIVVISMEVLMKRHCVLKSARIARMKLGMTSRGPRGQGKACISKLTFQVLGVEQVSVNAKEGGND